MLKKTVYLFLVYALLIVVGIASCEPGPNGIDCPEGGFPDLFKVTGLQGELFEVEERSNRTIPDFSTLEESEVLYNKFAISFRFEQEYYFSQTFDFFNFNLIQSAYACSPIIPSSVEQIDSILVTSSSNFTSEYPAGSNLTELFYAYATYNDSTYGPSSLTDYLNSNPFTPLELVLILKEQPSESKEFTFDIEYHQAGVDVDLFEFSTDSVLIRRD